MSGIYSKAQQLRDYLMRLDQKIRIAVIKGEYYIQLNDEKNNRWLTLNNIDKVYFGPINPVKFEDIEEAIEYFLTKPRELVSEKAFTYLPDVNKLISDLQVQSFSYLKEEYPLYFEFKKVEEPLRTQQTKKEEQIMNAIKSRLTEE